MAEVDTPIGYPEEFIRIAHSQVGVRETGQNRGAVEKYQRSAGIDPGMSYCHATVVWIDEQVVSRLSCPNQIFRTGLASLGRQKLLKRATIVDHLPQAHTVLLYWQFPNSVFGHIDIEYEQCKGGWVKVIAPNSGANARDGGGVVYAQRNPYHKLARMRCSARIALV